jgi:hypothetical protein
MVITSNFIGSRRTIYWRTVDSSTWGGCGIARRMLRDAGRKIGDGRDKSAPTGGGSQVM